MAEIVVRKNYTRLANNDTISVNDSLAITGFYVYVGTSTNVVISDGEGDVILKIPLAESARDFQISFGSPLLCKGLTVSGIDSGKYLHVFTV